MSRGGAVIEMTSVARAVTAAACLAAAGAACLPDVPVLGRPCTSDAECAGDDDDQNGVQDHYCQLTTAPNVCLRGEPVPLIENRPPVIESALVLARVGEPVTGRFTARDPDGDDVVFLTGTQEGDVGTLTVTADGTYTFVPDAGIVADTSATYQVTVRDVRSVPADQEEATTGVLVFILAELREGDFSEWTGEVSTAFAVTANWDPNDRIPDATVSIFVPPEVESRALVVTGERSVSSLFTSPGSRMVLGKLRVHGSQVLATGVIESSAAETAVVELVARPDVAGDLPSILVPAGAVLVSPVRVFGDVVFPSGSTAAPIEVGAFSLTVSGAVRQDPGVGGFVLDHPTASLIVGGDVALEDGASAFEEGLLLVGGSLRVGGEGLKASPALTVLLDGQRVHDVSFTDAAKSHAHHLSTSPFAGVRFLTDATVRGDLVVQDLLAVAPSRTVRVGGTLRLRAGFVTGPGENGSVAAAACEVAPEVGTVPPWIDCDAGPLEPPSDGGTPDGGEVDIDATLTVAPESVAFGEAVTFTWTATGADRCTLDGNLLDDDDDAADELLGGEVLDPRPASRTYYLRCVKETEQGPVEVERTAAVTVTCPGPVTVIGTVPDAGPDVGTVYSIDDETDPAAIAAEAGGGCFAVQGSLTVRNLDEEELAPLYGLTAISGALILVGNPGLTSLDGLELLETVEGQLTLGDPAVPTSGNPALVDVSALRRLRAAGGPIEDCPFEVEDWCFNGLDIAHNPLLTDLDFLRDLETLGGSLYLRGNHGLTSLRGLEGITLWPRHLRIEDNDALASLRGLELTTAIAGDLTLREHAVLLHLDELDGITSLAGDLTIAENAELVRIMRAESLTAIGGDLVIEENPRLSMRGLVSLTSVAGTEVVVIGNDCLPQGEATSLLSQIGLTPESPGVTFGPNEGCGF